MLQQRLDDVVKFIVSNFLFLSYKSANRIVSMEFGRDMEVLMESHDVSFK